VKTKVINVRFIEHQSLKYRDSGGMAIQISVRVGRRIQHLREKRGWTQLYLADAAGVGRSHLSQIENGAVSARIDTLAAIAEILEIPLSDLFRGS
jgi:DNA-binding XRE family transcriptional regulator